MILESIIIFGFILDMVFTYQYLNMYKKRFPKNDYTVAEANVLLRTLIRKFGLQDGIVYGSLILGFVVVVAVNLLRIEILYMMIGFYYSVNVHHFVNNRALKQMMNKDNKKEVKK